MLRETYIILILYLKCTIGDSDLQVDYSDLAGKAENNKEDILSFLKQPSVQEQYKQLYNSLLKKLIETPKVPKTTTTLKPAHHRRNGVSDADVLEGSTRRIVSGRNTSIAAVPWQVSLRAKTFPVCGGSVITDIWLITAAHCLLKARASDLSVRLGSSWKTHGGEMYDVRNSLVHPKYSTKTKIHDVGLIELYSQLRFSAKILPIGFVNKNTRLKAESPAIVSGWGKLKESGPVATYLQSTTIKTIAMKLCKNSGLDSKSIDPSTMFCAGSFTQPSPDACQGDSGGPIVYDGILIGVVSWGLGCARGNFPGVYTRLSNPITWDWIHNQISKKTSNCTVR